MTQSLKPADISVQLLEDLTPPGPWPEDQVQPLQQSIGYAAAMRLLGSDVARLNVLGAGRLLASGLVMTRRFLGCLTFSTLFRGPFWATAEADEQRLVLEALKAHWPHHRWRFLVVMPEAGADASTKTALKAAGLKQVMSGFSTVWLDLTPDAETLRNRLKGKWRNQLKRAEASGLTINASVREKHWQWLLEREQEQRRERRYQGLPLGLVPPYRAAMGHESVLGVTAHASGQKIAGALFLLHGTSATYHIGWAGPAARPVYAHNAVLFQSLLALKARGIRHLDLGGLNTGPLKGLARFKLGLGGTPITLAGSYL